MIDGRVVYGPKNEVDSGVGDVVKKAIDKHNNQFPTTIENEKRYSQYEEDQKYINKSIN